MAFLSNFVSILFRVFAYSKLTLFKTFSSALTPTQPSCDGFQEDKRESDFHAEAEPRLT